MNAMAVIAIISAIIYGIIVDGTYFKIYFILLSAYYVFTQIGNNYRYNTKRTKINISTWNGTIISSTLRATCLLEFRLGL
jgi:hypothetical protein